MMSEPIRIIPNEQTADAIVILPGKHVSIFNVPLPELPENKLLKILPGIMADYIAGDIQETHLSVVQKISGSRSLVAVCEGKWLEQARRAAIEKDEKIKAFWPDYALLEVPEKGSNIMKLSGRILGRRSDGTGFNVEERHFEHVMGNEPFTEVFESRAVPSGVGLATGKFSAQPSLASYGSALKRLAILGFAVLFAWLVSSWITISHLESERDRYHSASIEVFKKTYPEVTRIVNVEAQMKALSQQTGGNRNDSFVQYADLLFGAINASPGVSLETLNYATDDDRAVLNVTISTFNYSQVSHFESQLIASRFDVLQGESSQSAESIMSSYQLRRKINE